MNESPENESPKNESPENESPKSELPSSGFPDIDANIDAIGEQMRAEREVHVKAVKDMEPYQTLIEGGLTPDFIGKCVACALKWASEMQGAYGHRGRASIDTFVNRGLRMMYKTIKEDSDGRPLNPALVEPMNAVVGSAVRDRLQQG